MDLTRRVWLALCPRLPDELSPPWLVERARAEYRALTAALAKLPPGKTRALAAATGAPRVAVADLSMLDPAGRVYAVCGRVAALWAIAAPSAEPALPPRAADAPAVPRVQL